MRERTFQLFVTTTEPMLGSQPDRNVVSDFLAKKAGYTNGLPEDEIESLPEALERGTTVFHRNGDGKTLVIFDYQVKGFLKNAGKVLNGNVAGGVKALKSKVNDLVFVTPRQIKLHLPEGGEVTYLERPLRAETALGPRVALARSEMIPAGVTFHCGLTVVGSLLSYDVLTDLLDYGYLMGLGQWRNGGWGRFTYKLVEETE